MDMKKVALIGNVLKVIIAVVGLFLCVKIIAGDESIGTISAAINISMIALALCCVIALGFCLVYFAENLKKSKGALFMIGGFAAIAGISYSLAKSEVYPEWAAAGVTEQVSKLSGMGIYAVMLLLGLAVAAALFSELSKLKN